MTPKRIAYVLNIFPKISETFIAGELAELRRRGVELRILSLLPPRGELQHEIIRRAGLDRLVEYDVSRFADALREFQPELIHAHFAKEATEQARALAALTGVPFTFTAHGYDIHRKPPPDFRERAEAAGAVVTVSESNRDFIVTNFGVAREHINVIPCGVDTERFRPPNDDSQKRSSTPGPPLIVCVARLVAVKNLGLLLEVCALLRERGVKFSCAIIGDGTLNAELKAKRAVLRLDKIVTMPGAADQDEVLRWWQRASVGVLTSENEGMPVSLMEAAACGVPVVATRVGGIPELVEDGVTGILSPPGDKRAIADALEKLLSEPQFRERMGAAARERALKMFSVARQVDALLTMWSEVLAGARRLAGNGNAATAVSSPSTALCDGRVNDPFGALRDAALPALAAALDFETAWSALKRRLPRLSGEEGKLRLKAIRVTRHKPSKRAVLEYDVKLRRPNAEDVKLTLIGKVRVRRSGNEAYRLQDEIWNAGFQADSADGISVPEPLGVIADFQMWFQRKVSGVTAEEVFAKVSKAEGITLARRVAEAIHKLHCASVLAEKQHMMEDELRILRECFDKLVAAKPEWKERIAKLQLACEKLGASVSPPKLCGIHRDFYSAQVIVERELQPASVRKDGRTDLLKAGCESKSSMNAALQPRLWLIDFDLYCQGDPGLDTGNFIGHLTEQALRERGDAGALADVERALEDRFVELSGEAVRPSVRVYTVLTLARHIYLSTRFPERTHITERLLELCEQRLR